MKKLLLLLPLLMLGFAACDDDNEPVAANQSPVCSITAPQDGLKHNVNDPLTIKGTGQDPDGHIAVVKLTVGGKLIESVNKVPFEYTVQAPELSVGSLTIELSVEDNDGAMADHKITVIVEDGTGQLDTRELEFGYWTEEGEFKIETDENWTLILPQDTWLKVYNESRQLWEEKTEVMGKGETVVRIQSPANSLFEERKNRLEITTPTMTSYLDVTQEASPNMLDMLEDENLRYAAYVSVVIYEVDIDEDGKISAYEAEREVGIFGFDAGGWGVESVKGIEYFPNLKHLDVNRNPKITEVDLSGNPGILSLHIHSCPGLKSIDLSPVQDLMEIGCDFSLWLTLDIEPWKKKLDTVAVLNRESGPTVLDFRGFDILRRLYVYDNELTELNISGCTNLWLLSAGGNNFTELDLTDVDRDPDNMYMMTDCPKLEKIYVWKGFTRDYYSLFSIDDHVQIVEK